jgi:hypothetical protein
LTAFGKSVVYTRATAVFVIPFLLIYRIHLDFQYAALPVGGSGDVNLRNRLGDGCRPDDGAVQRFRASDPSGSTLFSLTPVIFPVPTSGWGYRLMIINPSTAFFVTSRSWLIGGELPMCVAFSIVTICNILLLLVAIVILKVSLPHIIERISG